MMSKVKSEKMSKDQGGKAAMTFGLMSLVALVGAVQPTARMTAPFGQNVIRGRT
jgi:hypothetical protein